MPRVEFSSLPDGSRLWIFGASRELTAEEAERILTEADRFIDGWAAHGSPLTGARDLVEKRFLLVAVDPVTVPPSGCSIDAMVRLLKGLESEIGVEMVSHGDVYVREGDGIARRSRAEFKAGVAEGRYTPESRVFDTTLTDLGRFRAGDFELPARDGWHGLAFFR